MDDIPRWKVLGERGLYDNPWVRLRQLDVEAPDGNRFWHHVVHLRPIASALVVNGAGRVLMLRRHRVLADSVGWELPGGFADRGEPLARAAAREAEEETGWRPTGPAEHVATFQPVPGMLDAPSGVYLFRGARYVSEPTATEEAGTVAWLSVEKLADLIRRGEIVGSSSLVGLLSFMHRPGSTEQHDGDQ